MKTLVWWGEMGVSKAIDITLLVVGIALVVVIVANTAILAAKNGDYKWWYGALKMAFYIGSFALAMATGGASAAIASVSTFLGMELNKLAQFMHMYGILSNGNNGSRARKTTEESQDTAER
jgi:hypothetical protein